MVEKNTETMLFPKAAFCYLTLRCGSLETWQSAALPHPSDAGEWCWLGSTAGRISCVFIGSIASGAAVDRDFCIHSVLVRLRAAVADRSDLKSTVSRRGCKAGCASKERNARE